MWHVQSRQEVDIQRQEVDWWLPAGDGRGAIANVLEMLAAAWLCKHTQTQCIECFKRMNLGVYSYILIKLLFIFFLKKGVSQNTAPFTEHRPRPAWNAASILSMGQKQIGAYLAVGKRRG